MELRCLCDRLLWGIVAVALGYLPFEVSSLTATQPFSQSLLGQGYHPAREDRRVVGQAAQARVPEHLRIPVLESQWPILMGYILPINQIPDKPVAYNYGLLSVNDGLLSVGV